MKNEPHKIPIAKRIGTFLFISILLGCNCISFSAIGQCTLCPPSTSCNGACRCVDFNGADFGSCSALPVELIYFNATPENNSLVRCDWSTATEQNNNYFAIERNKYGTNFEQIGTMPSGAPGGNSSTTLNYVFYDEHPYTEVSYYRLKQVDYNGQYAYSPIRQVYIGTTNIITIYPNPSSDAIEYTVGSKTGGAVTVKLIDVLGREVLKQEETIEGGITTKKLNVYSFAPGTYLLQVITPTQEKTQKQFLIK